MNTRYIADKAMTIQDLHDKLARYIAAGYGHAVVFAGIRDDVVDAAMQAGAEETGSEPMLVIGHFAFDEQPWNGS